MVVRIEDDGVGRQHGGIINEGVMVIAFPHLAAHGAGRFVGRQGVGQLVFVHIDHDRNVGAIGAAGESEKGGGV